MSSREQILGKLRAAQKPFTDLPPREVRHTVDVVDGLSREELIERFCEEATKLSANLVRVGTPSEGIEVVLDLMGEDQQYMSWDFGHIPLDDLQSALKNAGMEKVSHEDTGVRVGITGVDTALAATGSIVLLSGEGKARRASLLPDRHIAVLTTDQIVPNFETWVTHQKATWSNHSNITVISGPSRTADIAMELILGAHGPRELSLVLIGQ